MKRVLLVIASCFFLIGTIHAQTVNWNGIDEGEKNYVHLNIGYDFGVTSQFGYSWYIEIGKPALLTIDYSFPMGNKLFDDFKFRYGGQLEILNYNNFKASLKLLGTFKRHETDLIRIVGFGSESSILIGYYKSGWHVGSEFGFLKPILSNLKHSDITKENYPSIEDGWFTSPGGYFLYGIQLGKLIGNRFDISLRLGYTNAPADYDDAILPYYAQLGIIKRF